MRFEVPDWYERVDVGVRAIVHDLRNQGINTTCSCDGHGGENPHIAGHADSLSSDDYMRISNVMEAHGIKDYRIELNITVVQGWMRGCFEIVIENMPAQEELA